MDSEKTIELLKKKIQRETKIRKAAESLLEEKSTELYFAKLLVEDSLVVAKKQAEQDEQLLIFINKLESTLSHYNSQLLQVPPSEQVIQQLLEDLMDTASIKAIRLSSSLDILENEHLQSGEATTFDEFPTPKNNFQWNQDKTELVVYLQFGPKKVGRLHFIFRTSPQESWHRVIEKQYCLIADMISASFQRQLLLNKTIKEKIRAEHSEKSTRDFVAMINHELRTPLNGLLGAAELMEDTSITSYQKKLLMSVHQAGEMLRVIINDLLDISKMNAGMLELKLATFSPQTLIDTIEQIFTEKIKAKGLTFSCENDQSIPTTLLGDADRIKQILINLIGNSVKFTNQGSIHLHTSWQDTSLIFIISDTGCGIPQNKQASLFEPFTQVDNSSQRKFEGTGLGLSICKQLIELMNGEVSFVSTLDKGTEFTVKLPLELAVENNQSVIEVNRNTHSINHLRILAVEDIKTNQVILGMMLDKFSINYQFADNGELALEVLKNNEFDIILMDCRMPILDGFQTTKYLRKQGYTKPIIALTAGTTSTEVAECVESGMNDILHKPYKLKELEAALKKWSYRLQHYDI
ncbi:ATP-binding protein [Shewanella sp. 10N.286.51.B2]|uniref:ATP-binding protein n=1 Tax=Shewanella sp. 10N.286.51.B2 TaxID=3229707 RepID=UPI00354EAD9C